MSSAHLREPNTIYPIIKQHVSPAYSQELLPLLGRLELPLGEFSFLRLVRWV
jgi:hypothetical protein